MRETPDPIAALRSKAIPDRAAGARDLANYGNPDVIPKLVEMARTDKSPAVRLGTAGAASDILSRYRTAPRAAMLPTAEREALQALFRGIDPAINAGLFSMLAGLDLPGCFRRMAIGLRDPRSIVRVGASVGLRRLVLSGSHYADSELEASVVALLSDGRMTADARAEVARICAEAGYASAVGPIDDLELTGLHGETVAQASAVLAGMSLPLHGYWLSDGRDAGEVNPEPDWPVLLLVCPSDVSVGAAHSRPDGSWNWQRTFPGRGVRRMHFRRVGSHEPGRAFQSRVRTWYQITPASFVEALGTAIPAEGLDWTHTEPVADAERIHSAAAAGFPEGAASKRASALLANRVGLHELALSELRDAVSMKKVPADTRFLLGEALAAAGDSAGAKAAWTGAVQKAKKKSDWFVTQARLRLDG